MFWLYTNRVSFMIAQAHYRVTPAPPSLKGMEGMGGYVKTRKEMKRVDLKLEPRPLWRVLWWDWCFTPRCFQLKVPLHSAERKLTLYTLYIKTKTDIYLLWAHISLHNVPLKWFVYTSCCIYQRAHENIYSEYGFVQTTYTTELPNCICCRRTPCPDPILWRQRQIIQGQNQNWHTHNFQ